MQDNSQNIQAGSTSHLPLFLSAGALVLMILATLGIYLYTLYLSSDTLSIRDKTAVIDRQIVAEKNNRKVMIAHIIDSGTIRPSIDLVGLLGRFRSIATEYGVRFQGFSINNDILSTQVIATNPDQVNHPDPISAIFKLMNTEKFADTGFNLEPISSIAGDISLRSTAITFRVTSSR